MNKTDCGNYGCTLMNYIRQNQPVKTCLFVFVQDEKKTVIPNRLNFNGYAFVFESSRKGMTAGLDGMIHVFDKCTSDMECRSIDEICEVLFSAKIEG